MTNASNAARLRQLAAELRNKLGKNNERDVKLLEAEAAVLERLGDAPVDPKWSEQDRAVQLFLRHAYREALDAKPVLLSDLKAKAEKLLEVADVLRKQATTLHSLGKESEAQKLEDMTSTCDDDARNMLPRDDEDPWIITRQRGDLELRAFAADLSITTMQLFRKELHGTLATVANVVFNRQDMTRSKIREMLRSSTRERSK